MIEDTAIGKMNVWLPLFTFVTEEVLPGTEISPDKFWRNLERLIEDLAPQNALLLARRDALQAVIDAWHGAHFESKFDKEEYQRFLESVGYLEPPIDDFYIATRATLTLRLPPSQGRSLWCRQTMRVTRLTPPMLAAEASTTLYMAPTP